MIEVKSARYVSEYTLELEFSDGKNGILDFRDYIKKGGVFEKFRDQAFFKRFYIDPESRTLAWPEGIDLDPEMLHHKATGSPLPVWAK